MPLLSVREELRWHCYVCKIGHVANIYMYDSNMLHVAWYLDDFQKKAVNSGALEKQVPINLPDTVASVNEIIFFWLLNP